MSSASVIMLNASPVPINAVHIAAQALAGTLAQWNRMTHDERDRWLRVAHHALVDVAAEDSSAGVEHVHVSAAVDSRLGEAAELVVDITHPQLKHSRHPASNAARRARINRVHRILTAAHAHHKQL